jgi:NADPH:quinone reductase-like Zn-dependent oxidoreductase
VLVRVGAAGVNPADVAVRAGCWPVLGDPPFTVGWDVAGTVERAGDGAGLRPGERVFGMPRFPGEAAAYAEYVVAPADELARTPGSWTGVEAAAVPLAGLTAWQGLVETARIEPGQRVLIRGAGGGVGHLSVQIAKARGAHVVAVVSPAKARFVASLGADEIVVRTAAGLAADAIAPVDVAFDPFGSPDILAVLPIVKPGGVLVALLDVDDQARSAAERSAVRLARIMVRPSGAQLAELAALAAEGRLSPHVSATFPLEKAADAHGALAERAAGKIVPVP